MRTQQEILERIKKRQVDDIFGFEFPYYVDALEFDNAKEFLKPEVSQSDWKVKTLEDIRQEAIEYMSFAWDKANNCRGISANRSIMHYQAWLWLLGEDWGDTLMDEYEYYGKPQLEKICKYFGIDYKVFDDGIRSNTEY